jgi:hypothetical protein
MGFRLVEATNAWRMRRTRGEILRRFFRAAAVWALFDFADVDFVAEDFALDDFLLADFVVLEPAVFFGVSV